VNEQTAIEIRFHAHASNVLPDELALIESVLPELLKEMMQDDTTDEE
jgi:hypothetical protein